MPSLRSNEHIDYFFPWAYHNFAGFLRPDSPWLPDEDSIKDFNRIFLDAYNKELSIDNLEKTVQGLISQAHAASHRSIIEEFYGHICSISPKIILICGRASLDKAISYAAECDLLIIHEPFQLDCDGDKFPTERLTHIHPSLVMINQASAFMTMHAQTGCSNVALHIRRGDYSTWKGGLYYYDDNFWIELCISLFAQKNTLFVFSNEQDTPLVSKLVSMGCILSNGSPYEDMTRLMYMDRVIGPPSTFPLVARMLAKSCLNHKLSYEMLGERN